MKLKNVFILFIAAFVCLCGYLVMESGLFKDTQPGDLFTPLTIADAVNKPRVFQTQADPVETSFRYFTAKHAENKTVLLGSAESPEKTENQFKFAIELSSRGASIAGAAMSEYNKRDAKDQQPLAILSTVQLSSGKRLSSFQSNSIVIGNQLYYLSDLDWKTGEKVTNDDGSESVSFEAVILEKLETSGGQLIDKAAIKVTKTYTVVPNSYDIQIALDLENLSENAYNPYLTLQGPAGMGREGARTDMRAIVAGYYNPNNYVETVKREQAKLGKAQKSNDKETLSLALDSEASRFIWASVTNKYFAAILRPLPEENANYPEDVTLGPAQFFEAKGIEDISFTIKTDPVELAAAGEKNSSKSYDFQMFLGPKKKELFQEDPTYKSLGYIQTLSFMPCFCCPESLINPISFGIMALMKTMYVVVPNYGIVIIILVLFIRVLLHPVTKKSQVSMMRMQKLSSNPRMQEIKKKYANDRQELHKKTMEFYREQNVSPAAGMVSMLPMLLQMPIWIALYRAIYANIELRGASFLPVWITDLSSPDALIMFDQAFVVPLVGWQITSFNLLPILLGLAMFLQQKLMPHQTQNVDPQIAQQQKMMMFMMPVMMLIFLYTAPSGLNLYIMASTFGGLLEQKIIRKHIEEKEAQESKGKVAVTKKTGGKTKKKKPKPFYKT